MLRKEGVAIAGVRAVYAGPPMLLRATNWRKTIYMV